MCESFEKFEANKIVIITTFQPYQTKRDICLIRGAILIINARRRKMCTWFYTDSKDLSGYVNKAENLMSIDVKALI